MKKTDSEEKELEDPKSKKKKSSEDRNPRRKRVR
jgi:hypothetical protein